MMRFDISRNGYIGKRCIRPEMTDQGYYYITFPSGRGWRRVWVNRSAILKDENGEELVVDWLTYRKTSKGNIVLMPSENKNETIVRIQAECGYRGSAALKLENGEVIARGAYYHSPAGSLGVDDVILAKVRDGTKVIADRTGRLYGAPATVVAKFVFAPDGVQLIESEEEGDRELKQLL